MDFTLKIHYSTHDLSPELARSVLKNYMKMLDPLKNIFLEKDYKEIEALAPKLKKEIYSGKCSLVESVYARFDKELTKKLTEINKLIEEKHDYSKEEDLLLRREDYPKSMEERDEIWRKIIKYQVMALEETTGDLKEAQKKLKKRYELKLKDHKERTYSEVLEDFVVAFAVSVDPHTSYYTTKHKNEFDILMKLSLEGIGAKLSSIDGITTVQEILPGSPALKGKDLKVKDQIIGVAQGKSGKFVDVIDKNLTDVVSLIRGKKGTLVRLKVRRAKDTVYIPIVRDEIKLDDMSAKSTLFKLKEGKQEYRVGLVDLPSFYIDFGARSKGKANYKSSTQDVLKEIEKLKKDKMDLLILDLRSNGGGSLDEAVDLTGILAGKLPVVQIKAQKGKPEIRVSKQKAILEKDFPIIVMIDRQSASSSEIVAGALKDYDRALIVGDEHSFGKGTVQIFSNLSETLGSLKFTFSKFYRPLGSSTQLKGVSSHISFPGFSDFYEIGEKHYPNPLSWDEVSPLHIKKSYMVSPYLKSLKDQSFKRRKEEKVFEELEKALADLKEKGLKTKISLKKDKKKDSKDADKKDSEDRDKKDKKKDSKDTDKKDLKKKEEKDKKKEEKKSALDPDLNMDVYLRETLFVAGDYIRLLKKKKIDETLTIEGFKKEVKKKKLDKTKKEEKASKKPSK